VEACAVDGGYELPYSNRAFRLPSNQAADLSSSSCPNQRAMWFQLASVRLTIPSPARSQQFTRTTRSKANGISNRTARVAEWDLAVGPDLIETYSRKRNCGGESGSAAGGEPRREQADAAERANRERERTQMFFTKAPECHTRSPVSSEGGVIAIECVGTTRSTRLGALGSLEQPHPHRLSADWRAPQRSMDRTAPALRSGQGRLQAEPAEVIDDLRWYFGQVRTHAAPSCCEDLDERFFHAREPSQHGASRRCTGSGSRTAIGCSRTPDRARSTMRSPQPQAASSLELGHRYGHLTPLVNVA